MRESKRYDLGVLIIRIGLGLAILFYGSQKMLGVFGGPGYAATVQLMGEKQIPPVFANLAICAEFFGGLGVLVGLLTPVAAFGIACTMAVALYTHIVDPGVVQKVFTGEAPASAPTLLFPFILMMAAIGVMLTGSGKFSLDQKFFRKAK